MKTHKIFNLVIAFVFTFSLLGMPAPVLATSQASVQSAPFTTCADVTEIPQAECEALATLYYSTNGTNWTDNTDWLATNTPCSWYGVVCDGGYVTQLNLQVNQLSGNIPAELGNLEHLTYLNLFVNQLTGTIPAELGNLTQLVLLRLDVNQLTGSIPAELGNLTQLTFLSLQLNQLSGSIPAELGNLTQLTSLGFDYNQLSGSIPAELGNLIQLIGLGFGSNQLSGNIPAELGNLTQLTGLYLNSNQLSGSIPAELGNLTQLTGLYLNNNQLSGEFPTSVINLVNLTTLTFDCGLTSSDPAVIAFLNEKSPGWQCVPNPTFNVRANYDQVEAFQWDIGDTLTLTIDDPDTENDPDRTTTQVVTGLADWDPTQTYLSFDLSGVYDIQTGDEISISNGTITKNTVVMNLAFTDVDLETDTVTGMAEPNQVVNIWTCYSNDPCVNRNETANANGDWIANFAVPGEQDWEQDTADLRPGSWINSSVNDDDGDNTMFGWSVPNPSFSARLTDNEVHGNQWPLGTSVTLTIGDPNNGGYTDTQTVGVADWDPNQTFVQFRLWEDGFSLERGMTVTMSDEQITKTHVVTSLVVTDIDPNADTVSGTADPGTQVDIGHMYCDQSGCYGFRRVFADPITGIWVADFAHVGEDNDEQDIFDIRAGTGSEARQCDDDGECTQVGWSVSDPRMEVSYEHDWIQISGISLRAAMSLTRSMTIRADMPCSDR